MCFFFQAEDGIRDAQESRGLGDVYKRQGYGLDRQIEPIQGGLPSAQYYIPTLRTRDTVFNAVSYTHLTLPTIYSV